MNSSTRSRTVNRKISWFKFFRKKKKTASMASSPPFRACHDFPFSWSTSHHLHHSFLQVVVGPLHQVMGVHLWFSGRQCAKQERSSHRQGVSDSLSFFAACQATLGHGIQSVQALLLFGLQLGSLLLLLLLCHFAVLLFLPLRLSHERSGCVGGTRRSDRTPLPRPR